MLVPLTIVVFTLHMTKSHFADFQSKDHVHNDQELIHNLGPHKSLRGVLSRELIVAMYWPSWEENISLLCDCLHFKVSYYVT